MLVIMSRIKNIMGVQRHSSNPPLTVIDEYTEKKLMNMQLENLRSQINIENIDKQYDERNRIKMIDENVSDEINQIGENDEDRSTDYIEVMKLGTLCSKREIYNIEKYMMKEIR